MANPFRNIIEEVSSLTIGQVESVSPNEVKVLLEPQAPQATALNTGIPSGFPRINNYLLIPNEVGAVVGLIVWVGIERSKYPQRPGMVKDFGLVDLPYPSRKLAIVPLGTLVSEDVKDSPNHFRLKRGVTVFPSVGDSVLLPTNEQLKAIIQAPDKEDQRLSIGISPLAGNAEITVDPDKLFGRHLAVLGNTGSGKSCSVAGLIRWSLKSAQVNNGSPNARFIILDPNGEYSRTFSDFTVRIFRVSSEKNDEALKVPGWMWNSHEWCSFAHAAPGIQRPLLLQALRDMRAGQILTEPVERRVGRLFSSYKWTLESLIAQGTSGYAGWPANRNCGNLLSNIATDAESYENITQGSLAHSLSSLKGISKATGDRKHWKTQNSEGYNDFNETEIRGALDAIIQVLSILPDQSGFSPINEDAPIPFDVDVLPEHLEQIASSAPGGQAAQFIATLSMRIRMMLADSHLGSVVNKDESLTFVEWLEKYIGANSASNGPIAVVDLSLIPSDVIHIMMAVIARIVFEAIQRYKRINGVSLPTVLVLEEAHTFVRKGSDNEEQEILSPAQMCRQTFERIAREGRKFGLGLVVSSQRPSELSPTVLAQCNTFLLHRIVNDRDQELVSKLVPDNLGGLLKELPSLPSRRAILLGWTCSIPTLVDIHELPLDQRPKSEDPDFWAVWTGEKQRPIDWKKIANEWTKNQSQGDLSIGRSKPTRPSKGTI